MRKTDKFVKYSLIAFGVLIAVGLLANLIWG